MLGEADKEVKCARPRSTTCSEMNQIPFRSVGRTDPWHVTNVFFFLYFFLLSSKTGNEGWEVGGGENTKHVQTHTYSRLRSVELIYSLAILMVKIAFFGFHESKGYISKEIEISGVVCFPFWSFGLFCSEQSWAKNEKEKVNCIQRSRSGRSERAIASERSNSLRYPFFIRRPLPALSVLEFLRSR